jgi:hypothetical protein
MMRKIPSKKDVLTQVGGHQKSALGKSNEDRIPEPKTWKKTTKLNNIQ